MSFNWVAKLSERLPCPWLAFSQSVDFDEGEGEDRIGAKVVYRVSMYGLHEYSDQFRRAIMAHDYLKKVTSDLAGVVVASCEFTAQGPQCECRFTVERKG